VNHRRSYRGQGFAFPGLHLDNEAVEKCKAPQNLDVEGSLTQHPAGDLTDLREPGYGHHIHRLSALRASAQGRRFPAQGGIRHRGQVSFSPGHGLQSEAERGEVTAVTVGSQALSQTLGQTACHGPVNQIANVVTPSKARNQLGNSGESLKVYAVRAAALWAGYARCWLWSPVLYTIPTGWVEVLSARCARDRPLGRLHGPCPRARETLTTRIMTSKLPSVHSDQRRPSKSPVG